MKTEKDFYNDTWGNMTKAHRAKTAEFAFDVLEWLRRLKAEKLKNVIDRSKVYWAKKRQRQRVVRMLRLQKRFEKAMREVKENAHV